jgi:hypothetical protein
MDFKTETRLHKIPKEGYITIYSHLSYCSWWQFCLTVALMKLVCVWVGCLATLLVSYPLEGILGTLHTPVYTDPASETHNIPMRD